MKRRRVILRSVKPRHDDNWNAARILVGLELADQAEAIHNRHANIGQDQVRSRTHHCADCSKRVLRFLDFISGLPQRTTE